MTFAGSPPASATSTVGRWAENNVDTHRLFRYAGPMLFTNPVIANILLLCAWVP